MTKYNYNQSVNKAKNTNENSEILKNFKKEWILEKFDREADNAANKIAEKIKRLSTNFLRNLFGEIKKLQLKMLSESNNENTFQKYESQFLLLKAKIAYIAGRNIGNEKVQEFKDVMFKAHECVKDKETFERFVMFFTAILAYHKYYSEKRN